MEQVILGGYRGALDDTTTMYNSPIGGDAWDATESFRWKVVSADGIIKNLRVVLEDAPGIGNHYDFTLMVNGAPTALTVEIANPDTSGSNMVDEIDVAPGDTISIECDPDSTPAATFATWTMVFEGDTRKESLILGGSGSALSKTATHYCQVMGSRCGHGTTENNYRQVVPTAGTIKAFYVQLSEDPGTAPDAYRFTVRLNGATVAQSLIVTITADATAGNDLAHNLAVAAGDVLTLMMEPLNTPAVAAMANWGMTFVAAVDGESIVIGGTTDNLHNTNTEYNYLVSWENSGWTANEALHHCLGQVCTLKKLYMLLSAAPGVGNKYDFTVRIAVGDSNVVATVSGEDTTGDSGALEDTIALDEYVNLKVAPDSTPDAADAYWGLVGYIQPPPQPEQKSANMGAKMIAGKLI